jgi:hypothetical protein
MNTKDYTILVKVYNFHNTLVLESRAIKHEISEVIAFVERQRLHYARQGFYAKCLVFENGVFFQVIG